MYLVILKIIGVQYILCPTIGKQVHRRVYYGDMYVMQRNLFSESLSNGVIKGLFIVYAGCLCAPWPRYSRWRGRSKIKFAEMARVLEKRISKCQGQFTCRERRQKYWANKNKRLNFKGQNRESDKRSGAARRAYWNVRGFIARILNCSLSLWRVARGSNLMRLELIHGLFIT